MPVTPSSGGGRILPTALLVLLLTAGGASAARQDSGASPPVEASRVDEALDELRREGGGATPPASPPPRASGDRRDPRTREVLARRYRRYQQHQIALLEHRERLFRWQLTANQVSFWVVLVLVAAGLVFAGIQFIHSLRSGPGRGGGEGDGDVHELSVGTGGVTLRSSVIGLIILALSLGFFYLYLAYVFPLEEIGSAGRQPAPPAAAEPAAGEPP